MGVEEPPPGAVFFGSTDPREVVAGGRGNAAVNGGEGLPYRGWVDLHEHVVAGEELPEVGSRLVEPPHHSPQRRPHPHALPSQQAPQPRNPHPRPPPPPPAAPHRAHLLRYLPAAVLLLRLRRVLSQPPVRELQPGGRHSSSEERPRAPFALLRQ